MNFFSVVQAICVSFFAATLSGTSFPDTPGPVPNIDMSTAPDATRYEKEQKNNVVTWKTVATVNKEKEQAAKPSLLSFEEMFSAPPPRTEGTVSKSRQNSSRL